MAENNDAESQEALIEDLRDTYDFQHIEASNFESAARVRENNQAQFDIITNLMLAMAILAAIVGSVGLMSTMSINVVERAREIGVMRAIGASTLAVLGIFVSEGVLVGVISWLLVVPFSYPLARLFSNMIGLSLLEVPLDFSYPMSGVLSWLLIMVVLSALASLWPALRATKVSVREALAYE
jgi:putative ABC transport system permease protein